MNVPRWRRLAALASLVVAASAIVAGCGSSSQNGQSGGGKTYQLKFGSTADPASADTAVLIQWAAQVKKDTGGKVDIKVYPNSQLGAADTEMRAVATKAQFGFVAAAANLESLSPLFDILTQAYVFPNGYQQEEQLLNGDFGKQFETKLESSGMVNLGWINLGTRSILSKKKITTPAEMKGVKIRVVPQPEFEDVYKTLGALPNPIAYDQVYTALQTGVVDAMENAPTAIFTQKFYQVAHYYSLTNFEQLAGSYVVNQDVLNSLPQNYQDIVRRDASTAAAGEWQKFADQDTDSLTKMKALGLVVSDVDVSQWKAALGDEPRTFIAKQGADVLAAYDQLISMEQ